MTEDPEKKHSGPARGKARLTLEKILKRYGIERADQQIPAPGAPNALVAEDTRFSPRLDFEWVDYTGIMAAGDEPASSESPAEPARQFSPENGDDNLSAETETFHYVIQIAECALPLHCQVEAETSAAARRRVQRIPNLIAWREISRKELAEYQ